MNEHRERLRSGLVLLTHNHNLDPPGHGERDGTNTILPVLNWFQPGVLKNRLAFPSVQSQVRMWGVGGGGGVGV